MRGLRLYVDREEAEALERGEVPQKVKVKVRERLERVHGPIPGQLTVDEVLDGQRVS